MTLPARDLATGQEQGGFTLLELLVVLSILALLGAFAPRFADALPGFRFRRDVTDLANVLRRTHELAVATGDTASVTINASEGSWSGPDHVRHTLSTAVASVSVSMQRPRRAPSNAIEFLADGSATSAVVKLQRAGSTHIAVIIVDWISGQVRATR
jgi:prepilin-type N-terminal cleavage/methylation domain-containing protein